MVGTAWSRKTPEQKARHAAWGFEYRLRRRAEVLSAYGGRCACCSEGDPAFLVFDHKDGGGGEERRRATRFAFWRDLAALLPELRSDIQVLCANCNMAKERPGGCPHQRAT